MRRITVDYNFVAPGARNASTQVGTPGQVLRAAKLLRSDRQAIRWATEVSGYERYAFPALASGVWGYARTVIKPSLIATNASCAFLLFGQSASARIGLVINTQTGMLSINNYVGGNGYLGTPANPIGIALESGKAYNVALAVRPTYADGDMDVLVWVNGVLVHDQLYQYYQPSTPTMQLTHLSFGRISSLTGSFTFDQGHVAFNDSLGAFDNTVPGAIDLSQVHPGTTGRGSRSAQRGEARSARMSSGGIFIPSGAPEEVVAPAAAFTGTSSWAGVGTRRRVAPATAFAGASVWAGMGTREYVAGLVQFNGTSDWTGIGILVPPVSRRSVTPTGGEERVHKTGALVRYLNRRTGQPSDSYTRFTSGVEFVHSTDGVELPVPQSSGVELRSRSTGGTPAESKTGGAELTSRETGGEEV